LILKGKVIKYGDDINTDGIIPGRYLHLTNPKELALHAMEDVDIDFLKKISKGDIIIAGKNFGCGSSREQAAICLKYAGVGAIIAKSFARIFFRNAINLGLPVITSIEAVEKIDNGDDIVVDVVKGIIVDSTKNLRYEMEPTPVFLKEILAEGGLIQSLKNK